MLITEYMEGGDLYHAIAQDSIGRFAWYRRYDPQTLNAPSRVHILCFSLQFYCRHA